MLTTHRATEKRTALNIALGILHDYMDSYVNLDLQTAGMSEKDSKEFKQKIDNAIQHLYGARTLLTCDK